MRLIVALALGLLVCVLAGCPADSTLSKEGTSAPAMPDPGSGSNEAPAGE